MQPYYLPYIYIYVKEGLTISVLVNETKSFFKLLSLRFLHHIFPCWSRNCRLFIITPRMHRHRWRRRGSSFLKRGREKDWNPSFFKYREKIETLVSLNHFIHKGCSTVDSSWSSMLEKNVSFTPSMTRNLRN